MFIRRKTYNQLIEERNNAIKRSIVHRNEADRYKDALGDISEAIKHVSPNISLNAIKQIKDVLARFETDGAGK